MSTSAIGKPTGRPHGLTATRHARIIELLGYGVTYVAIAQAIGVHDATLHAWLNRGHNEQVRIDSGHEPSEREAPFLTLYEEAQSALAQAEIRNVINWQAQAATDWRASKEFLARRWPHRWGTAVERGEVQVQQIGADPVATAIVAADAAELARVVDLVISEFVPVEAQAEAVAAAREAVLGLRRADAEETPVELSGGA